MLFQSSQKSWNNEIEVEWDNRKNTASMSVLIFRNNSIDNCDS